jgi:hypothetical protein
MISIGLRAFLFLVLAAGYSMAQGAPFLVKNSRSPDGRFELWITSDEEAVAGTAQIRDAKTEKIVGTFDWSGFGAELVPANPEPPFQVLWRRDSKFFAIKWEAERGWTTGAVYGRIRNGEWSEVKMPSDQYDAAIEKLGGVTQLYGKGCDAPQNWMKNGDLVLEFVDRNLCFDHEDLEREFLITLKVADWRGRPLPMSKIVSIKQKSEEEADRDLQSKSPVPAQ